MDQGRRRRCLGQPFAQLDLALLQGPELILECPDGSVVIHDQLDQTRDPAVDPRQLVPPCLDRCCLIHPQPIDLAMELLAEGLEQIRRHEAVLQPVQDRRLQGVDADIEAVVTGPLVPGRGTAEQVLADLHVAGFAAAALGEAGDEEAGPLTLPEGLLGPEIRAGIAGEFLLPGLHAIPQHLIHDPQRRHILDDPRLGPLSRDTRLPVRGSFT